MTESNDDLLKALVAVRDKQIFAATGAGDEPGHLSDNPRLRRLRLIKAAV
jgi:hypothetical protein